MPLGLLSPVIVVFCRDKEIGPPRRMKLGWCNMVASATGPCPSGRPNPLLPSKLTSHDAWALLAALLATERQGTPPPHVACREARARATYYCQGKNVRSCYQERGSERVRDRTEPKRGGRGKRRPAVHERASAWSNFTGASRAKRARADGVMNGARAPRRPGARRGGGLEKRHLYLVTAQRRLGWTRPRMETAACGRTHMPCLRTARGLWVPHVM